MKYALRMRYVLWVFVVFGVGMSGYVSADEEFGEDDESVVPYVSEDPEPQYLPQNYVPGLYEAAISAETASQLSASAEPVASPAVQLKGFDELPFPPLSQEMDRDQDGLRDDEERRMGTDSVNPDSDGDGYIDGIEVVRGYNPLIASPDDRVVFAERSGVLAALPQDGLYALTSVRMGGIGVEQEGLITIGGVAPPLSLVRIFLFSGQGQVLVARTDESGRFLYSVDDELEMGDHVAYVAAVDVAGTPEAVSAPYSFQKTETGIAQPMISVRPVVTRAPQDAEEENDLTFFQPLLLGGVVLGVGLVVALPLLLWRVYHRRTIQT